MTDRIGWHKVDNQVNEIIINGSLMHTFVSSEQKKKTKRRTRELNIELKKFASLRSYNDYVKAKTNILRDFTDNEDTTDQETPSLASQDSVKARKKEKIIDKKTLTAKSAKKNLTSLLNESPSADSTEGESIKVGKKLDSKVLDEYNFQMKNRSTQPKITSTEIVRDKYMIVKGDFESSDKLSPDAESKHVSPIKQIDLLNKNSDDDSKNDIQNESKVKCLSIKLSKSFDDDSINNIQNESKEKYLSSKLSKSSDDDSEDDRENESKKKRLTTILSKSSDNYSKDDRQNKSKAERLSTKLSKSSDDEIKNNRQNVSKEKCLPTKLFRSSDDERKNDRQNKSKEKRLPTRFSESSDDYSNNDSQNESKEKCVPSKLSKSSDDSKNDRQNKSKEKRLPTKLSKSSVDEIKNNRQNESKEKCLPTKLSESSDDDSINDRQNESKEKCLSSKLLKSSDDNSEGDIQNESKEKCLSSKLSKSSDDDSEDDRQNESKKKGLLTKLSKSSVDEIKNNRQNESKEKCLPTELSENSDDESKNDRKNKSKDKCLPIRLSKSSDDYSNNDRQNKSKDKCVPSELSKSFDDDSEDDREKTINVYNHQLAEKSISQHIDDESIEETINCPKVFLLPTAPKAKRRVLLPSTSSCSQTISDPSDTDESIIDPKIPLSNHNDDNNDEEKDNNSDIDVIKNTSIITKSINKSIIRQINDQENIKRKVIVEKDIIHESSQRGQLSNDIDINTTIITESSDKSMKQQIREQENIVRNIVEKDVSHESHKIKLSNDIEETVMMQRNLRKISNEPVEPIILSRPIELDEFISREGLVVNEDLPTVNSKNIKKSIRNDDEEMWLMEIPRSIITDGDKPLCGKTMTLDAGQLTIDDTIYESNFKIDKSLSCILRTKKKPNYKIVNIEVIGYMVVGRKSNSHVITASTEVCDDKNRDAPPPLFPKNLKSRDPLDGLDNKPSNSGENVLLSSTPTIKKKRKMLENKFWNIENFIAYKKAKLSIHNT